TALLVDGANFFADADGNQTFDAGETTNLLTSLQQITVNGAAGVGSFVWRGDFTASNALQNLLVQNVSSTTIDANAVLLNSADVSADTLITFGSLSNLTINNDLTANVTALNGQITNSPSASLHVLDSASFSANGINLGLAAGDNIQFGSLTLTSTGSVQIAEDTNGVDLNPGTRFVGANTVGSIDLASDGSIQLDAGSSFAANTSIGFQANGLNSDIQIDAFIQSTNGSINLQSTDSILFGSSGSVNVSNAGNVVLTANSDALDGNGSDGIIMSDGSSIQVAAGTIRLNAENVFSGDITLGQITANTNAGTAIEIRTLGSILDGTALETANLSAANGAIFLLATNGAIGAGSAVADIDINAIRVIFNAPGVVQLTDLAGGIAVTGASTAGGGGFLAANSPLTISADINVAASMVFRAGNSALAGDILTIDTAAIVTLNSAVAGTLTFEAGDDIVFNTGRIVTTGGGIHSVVLSADFDNAGLGAADGDRGSISQNGTAIVEVTTNSLTADAATGINIDTTITSLTANNTVSGGIVIRETDGINLTSVVSTGGLVDISATGLVNATFVNAVGAGNDATILTTAGGIVVTNVTAANNVVLSATAGNITSGNIIGAAGSVGITATNGNVTIGSITAGTTVTIATPLGSINDAQNDSIADITAGGLITLTARGEIAGLAADSRLDLAAGSNVSAISDLGNILLRGLGALTLTNVATLAGFIDVLAQGTITAINVDSRATDTD
ncbi:MAG TPA: hypothetical protein VM260_21510, partial [Pirellula sp.]|nr:hypothetical protein [Pirellula sp.]